MKLLIFGPTGGTGLRLVEQALEQGHPVTAFARSPAKLAPERTGLEVVEGDVLDAARDMESRQATWPATRLDSTTAPGALESPRELLDSQPVFWRTRAVTVVGPEPESPELRHATERFHQAIWSAIET